MSEILLTANQAAAKLDISVQTWNKWVSDRHVHQPVVIDHGEYPNDTRKRWRLSAVLMLVTASEELKERLTGVRAELAAITLPSDTSTAEWLEANCRKHALELCEKDTLLALAHRQRKGWDK